jgi:hypothetical protein
MRLHRPLKRWGILDGNVDASVVRGDTAGTLRHGQQDLSREECEVSNKRVGGPGKMWDWEKGQACSFTVTQRAE